jgi:tetratricopeptide (TPR) repeat protein
MAGETDGLPPVELEPPTRREGAPRARLPPGTLRTGVTLAGRYRIASVLGIGGMGIVYLARDLTLELDIALKVLHPRIAHDAAKLAFFRNEVRVARMVTHPNVCRLHDLEERPDSCFITMEYIAGESLAARLARGPIELSAALAILRDVASGLSAAHAAGVVHRDLKPSNVLMTRDRAVVADFGIASEGSALGAGRQSVAGTPGYMAPEQASGGPLDTRVDVYAFGVLAFVLTTGHLPPEIAPTVAEPTAVPEMAALSSTLTALPPGLAALIADCVATAPADRPRDAGEVLRRLDAATWQPRRGRRLPIALAVLAGAAVIAAAIALIALTARSQPEHAAPPLPAITAPRIVVASIDPSALPERDRWLGAVVQRLVADELIDAWGLDVELGSSPHPAPGTLVVAGALARDRSGRFRIALEDGVVEASSVRELAIAVAARLVSSRVPESVRHPTPDELAAVGAHDPEAWRLWRRAEHETLLMRWNRANRLCEQALERDPEFPIASLELALTYGNEDAAGTQELAHAMELMKQVPVRALWLLAMRGARELRAGDNASAQRTAEQLLQLDLTPPERLWIQLRWQMARYYNGTPPAAIVPALELLTESHPDHPSAYKLLASIHLDSDQPTAPTLALRYAERAVEFAPEDASARAGLAIALLLAGRTDEARARAAELAQFDPEDKRLAERQMFTLHMALGDLAEAELDAERQLTGSSLQHAEGTESAAMIDLHWGRFDSGLRDLAAAADAYDAGGATALAARARTIAGRQAWLLGDRATARAAFERVAAGPTHQAGVARVFAQLAAGKLDDARTSAAALPEGSVDRVSADLAIADADRDAEGVLAAFARLEKLSTTIEYLYAVADALERTDRRDEAAAMFERLVNHTHAWNEPIATTRAWLRLGELRASAGNPAAARAAYAVVIQRWGKAATRIPEVDEARHRLRALR